MRFTVGDVEHSASIHTNTMRSSERTSAGIGFRAITSLARAERRSNDACFEIDRANDVVFRVGDV